MSGNNRLPIARVLRDAIGCGGGFEMWYPHLAGLEKRAVYETMSKTKLDHSHRDDAVQIFRIVCFEYYERFTANPAILKRDSALASVLVMTFRSRMRDYSTGAAANAAGLGGATTSMRRRMFLANAADAFEKEYGRRPTKDEQVVYANALAKAKLKDPKKQGMENFTEHDLEQARTVDITDPAVAAEVETTGMIQFLVPGETSEFHDAWLETCRLDPDPRVFEVAKVAANAMLVADVGLRDAVNQWVGARGSTGDADELEHKLRSAAITAATRLGIAS